MPLGQLMPNKTGGLGALLLSHSTHIPPPPFLYPLSPSPPSPFLTKTFPIFHYHRPHPLPPFLLSRHPRPPYPTTSALSILRLPFSHSFFSPFFLSMLGVFSAQAWRPKLFGAGRVCGPTVAAAGPERPLVECGRGARKAESEGPAGPMKIAKKEKSDAGEKKVTCWFKHLLLRQPGLRDGYAKVHS